MSDVRKREWLQELFDHRNRVRDLYLKYHPDKKPSGDADAFRFFNDAVTTLTSISKTWSQEVIDTRDLQAWLNRKDDGKDGVGSTDSAFAFHVKPETYEAFMATWCKRSPTLASYERAHRKQCYKAFIDASSSEPLDAKTQEKAPAEDEEQRTPTRPRPHCTKKTTPLLRRSPRLRRRCDI